MLLNSWILHANRVQDDLAQNYRFSVILRFDFSLHLLTGNLNNKLGGVLQNEESSYLITIFILFKLSRTVVPARGEGVNFYVTEMLIICLL